MHAPSNSLVPRLPHTRVVKVGRAWYRNQQKGRTKQFCFVFVLHDAHITAILHCVARLPSMINTVLSRSSRLLLSASHSPSRLICDVYTESALCAFTFVGYNSMFGTRHCKSYCESDVLCGSFICDARCARELNNYHLDDDIYYMCTV